uniref:Uncharacterized protein n=1 Tax=viral metagenome TaxID=1070528 RepID=A0A6M3LNU3_9ZZZZ
MLRTGFCVVHQDHVFPDDKDGGYCGAPNDPDRTEAHARDCRIVDAVMVPVDLDGIDLDASSLVISDLATAWWTAGAHQLESPAGEGDREYAVRWVKAVVRAALGIKEGGGV